METKDTKDVIEAVVATALCSAAALLVRWLGKKFLDHDDSDHTHIHLHQHYGELPAEEDEEEASEG